MKSKKRILWAETAYKQYSIKIYINPRMASTLYGEQFGFKDNGKITDKMEIHLNPDLLEDIPLFEETLVHELIHAVESVHGAEGLSHRTRNFCTKGATILGFALTQMLRELRFTGKGPRPPLFRSLQWGGAVEK